MARAEGTKCDDNLMCYSRSTALFKTQYKDIIIPFMAVLRARLVGKKISSGKYISPFSSFPANAKKDTNDYLSEAKSNNYKGLICKIK